MGKHRQRRLGLHTAIVALLCVEVVVAIAALLIWRPGSNDQPAPAPKVVTKTKIVTKQVNCLSQSQLNPLRTVHDSLQQDFGSVTQLKTLDQLAYFWACNK